MTWRFAVLFGLVLATSCSGTKEGPKGLPDPLTTTDGVCQRWGEAACNEDVVRDCNGSSGTTEECVKDQKRFCAAQLGDGPFDRELTPDCIDDVRKAYADGEITAKERLNVILVESGSCADLRASSQRGAGGAGGAGAGPLPKEPGARCDPDTDVCVDIAFCDPDAKLCALKSVEGEPCCAQQSSFLTPACESGTSDMPCAPGTFCYLGECAVVGETKECENDAQCGTDRYCSLSNTCEPRGEDNDACDVGHDEQCAEGYFCSEDFEQCRDFIVVGSPELCQHLGA